MSAFSFVAEVCNLGQGRTWKWGLSGGHAFSWRLFSLWSSPVGGCSHLGLNHQALSRVVAPPGGHGRTLHLEVTGCLCLLPCTILTQLCKGGIYILLPLLRDLPKIIRRAALAQAPKTAASHFLLGSRALRDGEGKSLKHSDTACCRAPHSTSEGPIRQEQGRDSSPLTRPPLWPAPASLSSRRWVKSLGRKIPEKDREPTPVSCLEIP